GKIDALGDMYAFGLLGAFTVTCLGLDIIRYRERRETRATFRSADEQDANGHKSASPGSVLSDPHIPPNHASPLSLVNGQRSPAGVFPRGMLLAVASPLRRSVVDLWHRLDFWLGLLTTRSEDHTSELQSLAY